MSKSNSGSNSAGKSTGKSSSGPSGNAGGSKGRSSGGRGGNSGPANSSLGYGLSTGRSNTGVQASANPGGLGSLGGPIGQSSTGPLGSVSAGSRGSNFGTSSTISASLAARQPTNFSLSNSDGEGARTSDGFTAGDISKALQSSRLSDVGGINKTLGMVGLPGLVTSDTTAKAIKGLVGLLGTTIGGIPGAAISTFGPSLVAQQKINPANVVGFGVNALTGSPVFGQAAAMATNTAMTGEAPSWGQWGGLASTAMGLGSFPGFALGNFAQTGEAPSAQSVANYAIGLAAGELGINPRLAQMALGGITGLAGSSTGGPNAAGGANDFGWGMWGGNRDASGNNTRQVIGEMPAGTGVGFGGGVALPTTGGVGLSEGGQGFGTILPDSFSLRPQSTPAARMPGRTIAREGSGEQSGFSAAEVSPGAVLARTMGGARLGF